MGGRVGAALRPGTLVSSGHEQWCSLWVSVLVTVGGHHTTELTLLVLDRFEISPDDSRQFRTVCSLIPFPKAYHSVVHLDTVHLCRSRTGGSGASDIERPFLKYRLRHIILFAGLLRARAPHRAVAASPFCPLCRG